MPDKPYDASWYAKQWSGSYRSALKVGALLHEVFCPHSVLDVGCGVGAWLKADRELGISTLRGLDGPWARQAGLLISEDEFTAVDLERLDEIPLPGRHDLARCLEVVEHLNQASAEKVIDLLVSSSDVVLFSAAIPRQGGDGHINEQWPAHWHQSFVARGFVCWDFLRWLLWDDPEVETWYKQNLLLYARDGVELDLPPRLLRNLVNAPPRGVTHPDLYENRDKLREWANAELDVRTALKIVGRRLRGR